VTAPLAGRPAVERTAAERALDRACGARPVPGNRVAHLCDGPEAYRVMEEVIDQAGQWIHFENYIIRNDVTGRALSERLRAAAGRGLRVRLLYDHLGSLGTSRRYWRDLRRAGVEVRAFNPITPFHPARSLRRDHCKYVSADGARAVLGGLCIGDEWAGREVTGRPPWRDTAVDVAGPAVPLLEAAFARRWRSAGGPAEPDVAVTTPAPRGDASVRVIDGIPGRARLYRAIELLVAGVADRLWITDAYLVAPTPLYAGLISAARDGVDVRLLLPGRTDLPAVRALTRVGYRELLQAGVRIWEWHGPMLHAKTVVADEQWFKVGSSNLNPSSLLANEELDILVEQAEIATAAALQFRHDLTNSVEIVLRPRRVPDRLASRIPPVVVAAGPRVPAPRGATVRRELSRRAAVTLSQVAGGASRSIAGAIMFVSLGAAALFLALPEVMGYVVAALCFTFGAGATWQFVRRRAYRGD